MRQQILALQNLCPPKFRYHIFDTIFSIPYFRYHIFDIPSLDRPPIQIQPNPETSDCCIFHTPNLIVHQIALKPSRATSKFIISALHPNLSRRAERLHLLRTSHHPLFHSLFLRQDCIMSDTAAGILADLAVARKSLDEWE